MPRFRWPPQPSDPGDSENTESDGASTDKAQGGNDSETSLRHSIGDLSDEPVDDEEIGQSDPLPTAGVARDGGTVDEPDEDEQGAE